MKPVIVTTAANSMAAYAAGIVALVETAPVRDIGRQSVDYVCKYFKQMGDGSNDPLKLSHTLNRLMRFDRVTV